jgi:hypothetical protein
MAGLGFYAKITLNIIALELTQPNTRSTITLMEPGLPRLLILGELPDALTSFGGISLVELLRRNKLRYTLSDSNAT